MSDDSKLTLLSALLVLTVFVVVGFWWLPQKWQACQKLYTNRPAQIVCFMSK
jgi:hypothetical protein